MSENEVRAAAVREAARYIERVTRPGLISRAVILLDLEAAAERMEKGMTARGSTRVVAEEPERPLRPIANASDYEAGMRWMCDDSSVWETRWDAREQQWVWELVSVPVKQEGVETDG